jgi:hypothetical protein
MNARRASREPARFNLAPLASSDPHFRDTGNEDIRPYAEAITLDLDQACLFL